MTDIETHECHICNQTILEDDYWSPILVQHEVGEFEAPAHTACTKQGVERWCREGRPHGSPLQADRLEQWEWTARPQTEERRSWPWSLTRFP